MSTYSSNVPLRSGFRPAKGFPRLSQVLCFGLQYRGDEEVMEPNGEEDLR